MGSSAMEKQVKDAILVTLSSGKMSKKKLVKKVLDQSPTLEKKEVKKALHKLETSKKVFFDGSIYCLVPDDVSNVPISSSSTREMISMQQSSASNVLRGVVDTVQQNDIQPFIVAGAVPFAEMLRQKTSSSIVNSQVVQTRTRENIGDPFEDIDDEIRRLEAELAAGIDSDDDDCDDNSGNVDESRPRNRQVSFGTTSIKQIENTKLEQNVDASATILCLSTVADERIIPLPKNCLPHTKKRTLKGIDKNHVEQPTKKAKDMISDGLKDAVKEILGGYVARSSERLPFYCRVCVKQYDNEDEFFIHKATDFHKAAVNMEQKVSFCKLCRKQFTSPVQLKEHLLSRPHKQQLDRARSGQRGGRGRDGHSGLSQRQWC